MYQTWLIRCPLCEHEARVRHPIAPVGWLLPKHKRADSAVPCMGSGQPATAMPRAV